MGDPQLQQHTHLWEPKTERTYFVGLLGDSLELSPSPWQPEGGDRVSAVCTRETREAAEFWFTGTLSTSRGRLASLKTLTPAMLFNKPRRPLQRSKSFWPTWERTRATSWRHGSG